MIKLETSFHGVTCINLISQNWIWKKKSRNCEDECGLMSTRTNKQAHSERFINNAEKKNLSYYPSLNIILTQ